jgi:hypothetical protein
MPRAWDNGVFRKSRLTVVLEAAGADHAAAVLQTSSQQARMNRYFTAGFPLSES